MTYELQVLLIVSTVLAGTFGLLIGSFLNVVIYRVPNGLSVVSPPSACPGCGSGIKAYDNIPVVSWLVLQGKCRNCREHISARYPLVEAGVGVFFAVVAAWWTTSSATVSSMAEMVSSGLALIAFLWLAGCSVALALIDLDTHKLPNAIVLPTYLVGGLLLAAGALSSDFDAVVRAGIGMSILWVAYFLMGLVYPGAMGFGDVKLAGALGLYLGFLGWGALIVGAFAAFFFGGLYAIGLMIARKANRKSGIPFGPWMLLGAWTGVFFGNTLWNFYLSLLGVA
jgi:leader peptidase (prepilin peptidase)/N-methyltransferase